MPKVIHDKLARQARIKGLTGIAARRYIYGTMNRIEHGEPNKRHKTTRK